MFRIRIHWLQGMPEVNNVRDGAGTPPQFSSPKPVGEAGVLEMGKVDEFGDHGGLRQVVVLKQEVSYLLQERDEALGVKGRFRRHGSSLLVMRNITEFI